MLEPKPLLERVSRLSPDGKLKYLAFLAHGLTVAARDGYEVGGTGLSDPTMVRKLNELQHQVTGALADLLSTGASSYTAESLTEMLLACRQDPTIERLIDFFVKYAIDQAETLRY